jgi:SAM-dependent methyltransferase
MRRGLHPALLVCLSLACESPNATSAPIDAEHQHSLERLESPERNAWAKPDEVVAALPLDRRDMDVADIGAGSGYFTRRIAKRVPEGKVFAVDVDGTYKHYIRDNREAWGCPNIETRLALYENPLLPEDSLDLVFLSNTYRYIQDREQYFSGVHASLRSGGRLAIVAFAAGADCNAIGEDCPANEDRVAASQVESELSGAGFVLETAHDFLPYQYLLIFARAQDQEAAGDNEDGSK